MKEEYTAKELCHMLCVCGKTLLEEDYERSDTDNFEHFAALMGTARLKFNGRKEEKVIGIIKAAYSYYVGAAEIDEEEFCDSLYMSKNTLRREIGNYDE